VGLNSGTFNILGNTGGAETHTLTINEMPSHSHGIPKGDANYSGGNGNTIWGDNSNKQTSSTGDNAPHNNLQPYIVLNYIIYTGYNILITPINTVTIPNAGIDDLVDVSITTPSDGQLLKYNSSGLNWTNSTIPIGGCFNGYITGEFPTANPANATTGNLFTVPITGSYVINVSASAWKITSAGMMQINIWINGVNTTRSLRIQTNELNSNRALVPISFRYTLNAGNNYLYLQGTAGMQSDSSDHASFNWVYSPVIV
jgi:hypothetical protein